MSTQRLEAFSDAVIAIIMTIMVLELKVPHEATLEALLPLWPVFLSYVLSFTYLAIYWNNHHHMMHVTERANGAILWANMVLLFWLSLVPFVTGWLGENSFAARPAAVYGAVLLMAAIAYYVLEVAIIRHEGEGSRLRQLVGNELKGRVSILMYVAGIGLAFVYHWASVATYALVALMWIVPDRRIERGAG
jgi:uncharacterized membrane protein